MSRITFLDERIYCVSVDKKERRVSLALRSDMTRRSVSYFFSINSRPLASIACFTPSPERPFKILDFVSQKRVGKGAGGQVFRETFSRLKGWKKKIFFLDKRAIPDAMAWRHHDSDVNDHVPKDGFSVLDVQTLTEQILRGMWSQCLNTFASLFCLVLLSLRAPPLPLKIGLVSIPLPHLTDQPISDKTDHQKEIEEEDPKIVAIRERKARAAAKKREKKKRGEDEREGYRPKVKRRKTTVARKSGSATSEHVSSPKPIRVVDPTGPVGGNPSGVAAKTAESWEDRSLHISPHDSANRSVHNYVDAHGDKETDNLRLGSFVDQSERALTNVNTEVL
ncbi:hypothetical protein Tco_1297754 [Tanacetum coccineum]